MKDNPCISCLKYDKENNKCLVFTELYQDWGKGECWSKEEDPIEWQRTLKQLEEYNNCGGKTHTHKRWLKSIREEIERVKPLVQRATYLEIMEAYKEDNRRGSGGGGEKADRTNKAFGPQQMKDNRFAHRKLNPKKWSDWTV